jgi:hypothetical protein
MNSEKTLAQKLEEQMSSLTAYKDKVVEVTYVWSGKTQTEKGELKEVNLKSNIKLLNKSGGTDSIPFLGNSMAIEEIIESGKILYRNQLVDESYSAVNSPHIRKECGFEK